MQALAAFVMDLHLGLPLNSSPGEIVRALVRMATPYSQLITENAILKVCLFSLRTYVIFCFYLDFED